MPQELREEQGAYLLKRKRGKKNTKLPCYEKKSVSNSKQCLESVNKVVIYI